MPTLNAELRNQLLEAYAPCPEFGGACHDMRWKPSAGHVPRGFCGATGELSEVALVLVAAEPGDPHSGEVHPAEPGAALRSTYDYSYKCFRDGKDQYHRNMRAILDLCFPGQSFDEQMRLTWLTESVLCTAIKEGGPVRVPVGKACRSRYLERQLGLLPNAVVAALGAKAASRLRGLSFIAAAAAAPPGCNFKGARDSWAAIASAVRERSS
jgi:hypothetical protein